MPLRLSGDRSAGATGTKVSAGDDIGSSPVQGDVLSVFVFPSFRVPPPPRRRFATNAGPLCPDPGLGCGTSESKKQTRKNNMVLPGSHKKGVKDLNRLLMSGVQWVESGSAQPYEDGVERVWH